MTERLTATITTGNNVSSAVLGINPMPVFGMTWATYDNAHGINPGTSGSPPNYLGGDGLVQTYTYVLTANLTNYPPGTVVDLISNPVAGFTPANIATASVGTDSNRNAVFVVTFNETPTGTTFNPNPYGNGLDLFAGFTFTVLGIPASFQVPVLYSSNTALSNWSGPNFLRPGCNASFTIAGGGGAGGGEWVYNSLSVGGTANGWAGADGSDGSVAQAVRNPFSWPLPMGTGAIAIAGGATGAQATLVNTQLYLYSSTPGACRGMAGIGNGGGSTITLIDNNLFTLQLVIDYALAGSPGTRGSGSPGQGGIGGGNGMSWGGNGAGTNAAGMEYGSGGGGGAIVQATLKYIPKIALAYPLPPFAFNLVKGIGGIALNQAQSNATAGTLIPVAPLATSGWDGVAVITASGAN